MEGVDDGKNRVGGDLLLMILEALFKKMALKFLSHNVRSE